MKYSKRFLVARTNDDLELPVYTANSNREMADILNVNEFTLAHCIMDNVLCKGLKIDIIDCQIDLKEMTFEDYKEYCMFEKINPCKYESTIKYRKRIKINKMLAYMFNDGMIN